MAPGGLLLAAVLVLAIASPVLVAPLEAEIPSSLTSDSIPARGLFTENAGQLARGDFRFIASAGGIDAGFTRDSVLLRIADRPPSSRGTSDRLAGLAATLADPERQRGVVVRIVFEGARSVEPRGIDEVSGRSHFLLGRDPARWRTDVRSFREVVYPGLYEGIDLRYRVSPEGLKYEFLVAPGSDPASIRIRYDGVDAIRLESGGVVAKTGVTDLQDSRPTSYEDGGREVECSFALRGPLSVGLDCRGRDPSRSLTIDPLIATPLIYGTFLGGWPSEWAEAIAVDASGNAYVAGLTHSYDFPVTPGAYDRYVNGSTDAFVAKFTPDGSALVFATYLGGNGSETAHGLAVDAQGYVYLTGETESIDFPVSPDAFDRVVNGTDAFVVKLGRTGSSLVYSTLLGGKGTQRGSAIAVDGAGSAYVTGSNVMGEFPTTPGALDVGGGVFVAKLSWWGDALLYGALLGQGYGMSIVIDPAHDAFVAGITDSPGFPATAGAFDTTCGTDGTCNAVGRAAHFDAFVAKVTPYGASFAYATFLGGSKDDMGFSLALDPAGDAVVVGRTDSSDFPVTTGVFGPRLGRLNDSFAAKVSADGSTLMYGTFLGGSGEDYAYAVGVDGRGRAYVTGYTESGDFPVLPVAMDATYNGLADAFIAKISPDAHALLYSTYAGGTADDYGNAIAVDTSDGVYVAGFTQSTEFPTTPLAFQTRSKGIDAFLLKVDLHLPDLAVASGDLSFVPADPVVAGTPVAIQSAVRNVGDANASDVIVRFYDGPSSGAMQIGTDRTILRVDAGGTGTASVSWNAGPPGRHAICVLADADDAIAESDESNNEACSPYEVVARAGPDLSVSPEDLVLTPGPPVLDGTSIRVSATVRNLGTDATGSTVARFFDGVPPAPQIGGDQPLPSLPRKGIATVSVSWTGTPPGDHVVCVRVDPGDLVVETNESNNEACIPARIVSRPDYLAVNPIPSSPATVGLGKALTLSVRVANRGGSAPDVPAILAVFNATTPQSPFIRIPVPPVAAGDTSGPFLAEWVAPAIPGAYAVTASVDYDGAIAEGDETNNNRTWTIEVVPGPETALIVGDPNVTAGSVFVTASTPLRFSVTDRSGLGILKTNYRVDGGPWVDAIVGGPFHLSVEGGRLLEWFSEDRAGNEEALRSATLRVDDTPPATTIAPIESTVLPGTDFRLSATDSGSGVARTEYRVDGGPWRPYSSSFTLPEGTHLIGYRSTDRLGNEEVERADSVTIASAPAPGPEPTPNWKPLLATAFAAILALAGAWSSRRAPWRAGSRRRLRAFALVGLPFVAAECGTGVASAVTGVLTIPPLIGLGTATDVAILCAGLVVSVARVRSRRSGKAGA